MKTILLLFTICQASIEKWAIKHGVTFHPEKLRWRQVSEWVKKSKMLNLPVNDVMKELLALEY